MVRIEFDGYPFECHLLSAVGRVPHEAGVYVIMDVSQDRRWKALDVGESGWVGERIATHERSSCWRRNSKTNNIWVGIRWMPTDQFDWTDRADFERYLRGRLNPPCGDR